MRASLSTFAKTVRELESRLSVGCLPVTSNELLTFSKALFAPSWKRSVCAYSIYCQCVTLAVGFTGDIRHYEYPSLQICLMVLSHRLLREICVTNDRPKALPP